MMSHSAWLHFEARKNGYFSYESAFPWTAKWRMRQAALKHEHGPSSNDGYFFRAAGNYSASFSRNDRREQACVVALLLRPIHSRTSDDRRARTDKPHCRRSPG